MVRAHAERAAINTPIQGGAADVVMKAMLVLQQNQRFAQLGWRIVLQVPQLFLFHSHSVL
jgi:DNA polymerase-1